MAEALSEIADLYEDRAASFTSQTNESQTEEYLIKPILRILGWEYEPQQPVAGVGRTPDYALLTSREEWEAIQELKGTPELWEHCAAVGDAKRWKQDLDRRRDRENPTHQITEYLWRSRVRWGILTNGAKWRLYEQDRSRGGGIYYEVDLLSILQSQNLEAFRYFYLFFRKDAFVPVRDEKSFVEIVYEGSERYRTEVGDSLKEAVYDALRHLMNGFCRYPDNQLDPSDAEQLKRVHDLSLVLLYRIIFLLYAEDMDLLPAGTQPYADYSMVRLQKQINSHLRSGARYVSGARGLWHDLLDRFALIDQGLSDNGERIIPAYNGGLFSCQRDPEIAYERQPEASRWEIGDSYLAEAIDLLAYQRESWHEPGSQTVDYATLGVQHLGAIYEGLLELKPQVASEPMIEQPGKSGKPPVVKKKSEVKQPKKVKGQTPREFAEGEVYLVTDRGERKATGSYYTPKYIVDYIVEHTVGELAEAAAQEVASHWAELAGELDISAPEQWPELLAAADQEYERRELEEKQRWLLAPYLDLKILDPAMGSGHFLVGASDHLSLAMATDPHLPPVPETEEADVQAYYKRLVVEHCLYGVDLNPLAVELAKLSLWLHTVSRDKALSFLDHHLRCGNSLIGARLQEDLTRVPPPLGGGESKETVQIPLGFDETLEERDLAAFLDTFRKIVEAPTGDAEIERDKDRWFQEMDRQRNRYRQVANLWLAPYFGVEVSAEQYSQALEALREGAGSEQWQSLTGQDWFKEVQQVARERNFFHWELEFPEAFFEVQDSRADWKPEEQQGFDATIGNPPWMGVRTGLVDGRDVSAMKALFETCQGQFDLAALFLELGAIRTHTSGFLGMVVPKRIATNESFITVREIITEQRQLTSAIDLGVAFPDVNNDVMVATSGPKMPKAQGFLVGRRLGNSIQVTDRHWPGILQRVPYRIIPMNCPSDLLQALLSASDGPVNGLGAVASIARGAECGMNHSAISLQQANESVKLLNHLDVDRHQIAYSGWSLDLRQIPDSLVKDHAIYETVPKLVVRFLASDVRAAVDTEGYYSTNLLYHIHPQTDPYYTSSCLNACLVSTWYRNMFQNEEVKFPHVQKSHLQTLPIRIIDFDHRMEGAAKQEILRRCREAIKEADYVIPYELARKTLATHALLHGPAGKPELKEAPYWQEQIAGADPEFPGREDFVHDLLAMLAQRMIDLNKEKHQLIEQFETDLRGAAPADLHDDLQRGKQGRSLYKHESCQPYVEEDSYTTHHLPETLAWSEAAFEDFLRELIGKTTKLTDFLTVYEKYAADYREVAEALEKTDHLIDQIVYALYGLTEEEIAIVEESVGQ